MSQPTQSASSFSKKVIPIEVPPNEKITASAVSNAAFQQKVVITCGATQATFVGRGEGNTMTVTLDFPPSSGAQMQLIGNNQVEIDTRGEQQLLVQFMDSPDGNDWQNASVQEIRVLTEDSTDQDDNDSILSLKGSWGSWEMPADAPPTTTEAALERLRQGNARYVAMRSLPIHESTQRRMKVAPKQEPFAVILSCIDSRVPPELIFDQGLGDLFVVRTAGQVTRVHNPDEPLSTPDVVLGSVEYTVRHTPNIRLILVMGHQNCGAVDATLKKLLYERDPEALGRLDEHFATELATDKETHILNLVQAIAPNVTEVFNRAGLTAGNVNDEYERLRTAAIKANALAIATQLKSDLAADYHNNSSPDGELHEADDQHGATRYTLNNVPVYYGVYDFDSGTVNIDESPV